MSDIVKVTVIIENADGQERTTMLAAIPGEPFAEFEWSREPAIDHAAEAQSMAGFRIMKPGPNVGIKLAAYGRVIE